MSSSSSSSSSSLDSKNTILPLVQSESQQGKQIISPPPSWSVTQVLAWLEQFTYCGGSDIYLLNYFTVFRHERGILFYKLKPNTEIAKIDEEHDDDPFYSNMFFSEDELEEGHKNHVCWIETHNFKTLQELNDYETNGSISMEKYKTISKSLKSLKRWCDNRNIYSNTESVIIDDVDDDSEITEQDTTDETDE